MRTNHWFRLLSQAKCRLTELGWWTKNCRIRLQVFSRELFDTLTIIFRSNGHQPDWSWPSPGCWGASSEGFLTTDLCCGRRESDGKSPEIQKKSRSCEDLEAWTSIRNPPAHTTQSCKSTLKIFIGSDPAPSKCLSLLKYKIVATFTS